MNVTSATQIRTMHSAILQQNLEQIQECIDQGVDLNSSIYQGASAKGKQTWSFLYYACIYANETVIRLLMENGAKIPQNNAPKYLSWIIEKRSPSLLNYCLDEVGSFSYSEDTRESLIEQAARIGNTEAVKSLLKFGDDVNFHPKSSENSPLHSAVKNNEIPISIIRQLIESGANINHQNSNKTTPLHLAIRRDRLDVVNLLLKQQAAPDCYNKDHNTPINLLFRQNHVCADNINVGLSHKYEIARSLLEAGCKQNAIGKSRDTPLYCAVLDRDTRMVELLIEFSESLEKANYDRARLKAENSLDEVLKKIEECSEKEQANKEWSRLELLTAERDKLQTIVQLFQRISREKSARF